MMLLEAGVLVPGWAQVGGAVALAGLVAREAFSTARAAMARRNGGRGVADSGSADSRQSDEVAAVLRARVAQDAEVQREIVTTLRSIASSVDRSVRLADVILNKQESHAAAVAELRKDVAVVLDRTVAARSHSGERS